VQAFFGKQLPAETKKILQKIFRQTGWKHLNWLQVSANRQGSGLPESLFWTNELFNQLAGELGQARLEIPFERQAYVESLILPSGQLISPDDVLSTFIETAQKFNIALQQNSGQVQPFPGKLAVRAGRLVLVMRGLQAEIKDLKQLEGQLARYFQPRKLPDLLALPPEEIAASIVTEDDLGLYEAVCKVSQAHFRAKIEPVDFQLVVLHNFRPLGLLPFIREVLPASLILWHNHLATIDPTPVVWNYFVPFVNQANALVCHLPEYDPTQRADLLPITVPTVLHMPSIYPYSPKNCELANLGEPIVKRVLAQYQRDYILASKYDLKLKLERAYLKTTGNRISDVQVEAMLDSLTKASIRAAFIEEGRRPEVDRFIIKAANTQAGMLDMIRQLHGIDPVRPLFTQISRYARFKDPVGTVRAFVDATLRLVREGVAPAERPQFAYAGSLEGGNQEAFEELVKIFLYLQKLPAEVRAELGDRPAAELEEISRQLRHDIFILILPNHDQVANAIEVNALQRASRAVLQKSLRESFGLSVTEAMWKGVPVIGGNTGGIRLQIDHGTNGFLAGQLVDGELVDSVEDTAQYLITYARHPDVAQRMGEMAKRKVGQEFLMPVNLHLWLQKISELLANAGGSGPAPRPERGEMAADAPGPESGAAG
jgi:glycosyltransferase involved in cell wall biosynthesis